MQKTLAKAKNIETKQLIDEGNNDYRINIELPILYQFKDISSYHLTRRYLADEVAFNRHWSTYDKEKNERRYIRTLSVGEL